MPQISKIRIVNFQYNEGKRLIADELYDFERESKGPSDVLINLANGGGKSVLVQLIMQPVIPKARVAGRKIESFFTRATDHCYVVIEWTLDGSKSKLMTGIAMAAGDSSADSDADMGFQVKYYTFISNYINYQGNYNIISLPLSKKENGRFVPAAFDDIRNLAKKSAGGLERFSSDDGVKWGARLKEYGIVQNEWRMIEELNSNEDGLSKYFSTLKTSDAVIDRLIVPRIEEKKNHAGLGEDSSLETMLISYAKQFSKQQEIIKERDLCKNFSEMLEITKKEAEELWKNNDLFEKSICSLYAFSDAINREISLKNENLNKIKATLSEFDEKINHINWEKVSETFYQCKEAFEKEKDNYNNAEMLKEEADERMEAAKKKLLLIECAYYYEQLKSLENQISAISEEIKNRENNSESAEKLAALKYSAFVAISNELNMLNPQLQYFINEKEKTEKSIAEIESKLASLIKNVEMAKTDSDKKEAILNRQIEEDDRMVQELGIEAFRMLDGKYLSEDLEGWQKNAKNKEKLLADEIKKAENELFNIEKRKEEIPEEIANISSKEKELYTEKSLTEQKLFEYNKAEEKLRSLFEKYGLDFELRFSYNASIYIKDQLSLANAKIADEKRKIESTNEAISAVQRGTLHIPKLVTDFLDSTGIHYTSVEKYLLVQIENGNLRKEKCNDILTKYPFAAYGIKVDLKDMAILTDETENQWLPAMLPVFTDEDLSAIIGGEKTEFTSVSAYSKEYFKDNNAYGENLKNILNEQNEHLALLENNMLSLTEDEKTVKSFAAYNEDTEKALNSEKEKILKNISIEQENKKELQIELEKAKERAGIIREREKSLNGELLNTRSLLAYFEKLLKKLTEEDALYKEYKLAEKKYNNLKGQQKDCETEKSKQESILYEITEKIKELNIINRSLNDGLARVSGTEIAEIIDEKWDILITQYDELLASQNEDLKILTDRRKNLQGNAEEKKKELSKRDCKKEEYENIIYSEDGENQAKNLSKIAEADYKLANEKFVSAGLKKEKAEAFYQNAEKQLENFGGKALEIGEIGKDFDKRIADLRLEHDRAEKNCIEIETAIAKLEKIQSKTDIYTEQYERPVNYSEISLENDYQAQLNEILKHIKDNKLSVNNAAVMVKDILKKTAELYGGGSADINLAITSMQNLMEDEKVKGDRYYTLCEHIDANMHTTNLRISQIDTDLKEFNKTKGDLIRQCLIQGRQMYDGLLQLSNNSRVKVQEKRRQMLKFDIPENIDENVATASITAEIDRGTDEIVEKMAEDSFAESEIRKIAGRVVGSKRLLRKYIGFENIVMKAYKIDRNPDNSGYRTWEQTQVNNSGAEKFVVYFAVILALMAYTRDEFENTDSKESRSVLVLDNPFGPISSKHVLEPMFEISKNYNVQMICLSDISKSDIVSCFDLVIRAVVKKFALSSKEQLTHEGNERIEHGFYRSEQLNIFS